MIGIYKITSPSGKVYIGQSKNIYKRWKAYYGLNCVQQPKIYNSLMKYGVDRHKFEVLERCKQEELLMREYFYIQQYDSFKNGLNACPGFDIANYASGKIEEDKVGLLGYVFQELFDNHRELYNDVTDVIQAEIELRLNLIVWHSKKEKEGELRALQTRLAERSKRFMNKYSEGILIELKKPC